jgi:hypothetical protein
VVFASCVCEFFTPSIEGATHLDPQQCAQLALPAGRPARRPRLAPLDIVADAYGTFASSPAAGFAIDIDSAQFEFEADDYAIMNSSARAPKFSVQL